MRWTVLLVLVACGGKDSDSTTVSNGTTAPSELVADAGADVSGLVGEALTFDGSASVGSRFVWDFGDGNTAEGAVATHSYAAVGNYTAVLQALDEDGAFRTDSAVAVAHGALGEVHRASTVAVDSPGQVWVVDRDAGQLHRVGNGSATSVDVCAEPRTVAAFDGVVAVTCDAGQLVEIDAVSTQELSRIELGSGSHPWGVVPGASGWIVGLQGAGELVSVDSDVVSVVGTVDDVRGLARGTVLVGARYRSTDGVGRIVGDIDIALPFDPGPDSDTTIRGVPTGLEHLVLSPDSTWLYASGTLGNTARGHFVDGQTPTFETSVRAFVDAVDPATGAQRWRKQFDDHGMAGPMVLSELGNWLFVGFPTTRDVLVVDAYNGDIVSSILDAGRGIRGLALDGDTLYVHAWLDRELRAYDISTLGSPTLSSTTSLGPEPLPADVALGRKIFWDASDTRMAKAGYLACAVCHPDGEHDGLTWDFTDRGEGLRNTTSLLGRAGTGMGPLHWTANFDEVQDFEHDIRGPFGGSGFLSEADWAAAGTTLGPLKAGRSTELDALAAYLVHLDQTPVSPHPADLAGQALFTTAGCDGCHPAPLYTDSADGVRHDIGSLGPGSGQRLGGVLDGLDTPTLLGAWQTGPWLHDGSAVTVDQAIEAHNSAAGLSAGEISALAAFVRSL